MLFDAFGAIKKYETVKEIIGEFFKIRLELYAKRKEYLQGILQAEADRLKEQARFILEKIDGTIVIGKVSPHLFCVSRFFKKAPSLGNILKKTFFRNKERVACDYKVITARQMRVM